MGKPHTDKVIDLSVHCAGSEVFPRPPERDINESGGCKPSGEDRALKQVIPKPSRWLRDKGDPDTRGMEQNSNSCGIYGWSVSTLGHAGV